MMRTHRSKKPVATLLCLLSLGVVSGNGAEAAPWGTDEEWTSVYDGPGHRSDRATDIIVAGFSEDAFVTGLSVDAGARPVSYTATTVRYDIDTGRQLWVAREHLGAGAHVAGLTEVSVGPPSVVVAMSTATSFVTVSYDEMTGEREWRTVYTERGSESAEVHDIVGAGGAENDSAIVTGEIDGDFLTISYESATGEQSWLHRARGGEGLAIAKSPAEGDTQYVTGIRDDAAKPSTFAFIGGNVVWKARVPSRDIAATDSGVYLSGTDSVGPTKLVGGHIAWQRDLNRSFSSVDVDRRKIYLGEATGSGPPGAELAVLKARNGDVRSEFLLPDGVELVDVALSLFDTLDPVYLLGAVRGTSGNGDNDYLTMAVRPSAGVISWRARFGAYGGADRPASIDVADAESSVVVTGATHAGAGKSLDFGTVAYAA